MFITLSNRRALTAFLAAFLIVSVTACTVMHEPPDFRTPPSASDVSFEAVGKRYLTEMLALSPVNATAEGDHRFDTELDDVSANAVAKQVGLARQLLAQLDTLEPARMSRAHQVDARLLRNELDSEIWQAGQLQEWRWNPVVYTELAGNSVYGLMARDFAPLPVRLHAVAMRLNELPRFLAQVRESLDLARVPHVHAETAVKQNDGVLSVIDEMVVPQMNALPEAQQAELKAAIAKARTAVAQHQIWLEKKLLPAANGDFRIGASLYDTKLHFALQSNLSRQEIRTRAEAALKQTRSDMYDIARAVLAGRNDAPPLPIKPTHDEQQAAIAAALELAYKQKPARDKVFDTTRDAFQEVTRFVREHDLVTVYDDPIDIIPMPKFSQGVSVAYCDPPGPLDKGQKTFFDISPIPADWSDAQVDSFLREYNTRSIYELTIHEAMPGHYLQLTHANRYDSPLRAVLASGPFIEGWAVYGESMMVEEGVMNHDPLMRLINLKWNLRAIANAIIDQGVHVDGMTREEVIRLLTHETFQQEREAAGKWNRVQLTSAQLPTYFVGFQEHLALRAEAKRVWGREFTLKRYHDAVLAYGSPPVRYVRELMLDLPIE